MITGVSVQGEGAMCMEGDADSGQSNQARVWDHATFQSSRATKEFLKGRQIGQEKYILQDLTNIGISAFSPGLSIF